MTTSYDIAIIMDAAALDKGLKGLYDNHQQIFSGTKPVGEFSITSVDWSINASPTFTLAPPTSAQWTDSKAFFPSSQTRPTDIPANTFQVTLSSFSTTIAMQTGTKIPLTFDVTAFVEVTIQDYKVVLGTLGILPNKDLSAAGEGFIQIIGALVYAQVSKLLAGYKIPHSIPIEGENFTLPIVDVTGSHLVLASNLTATKTPPDITGVTWPDQSLAVFASRALLTALVHKFTAGIVSDIDSKPITHNGDFFAGDYSLSGSLSNTSIAVDSTLPKIDVTTTVSATANLNIDWWAVPLACALESASNLIPG